MAVEVAGGQPAADPGTAFRFTSGTADSAAAPSIRSRAVEPSGPSGRPVIRARGAPISRVTDRVTVQVQVRSEVLAQIGVTDAMDSGAGIAAHGPSPDDGLSRAPPGCACVPRVEVHARPVTPEPASARSEPATTRRTRHGLLGADRGVRALAERPRRDFLTIPRA